VVDVFFAAAELWKRAARLKPPPLFAQVQFTRISPAALDSPFPPSNMLAGFDILLTQRNYYGREQAQQLRYTEF
jgi:hypothetical protein